MGSPAMPQGRRWRWGLAWTLISLVPVLAAVVLGHPFSAQGSRQSGARVRFTATTAPAVLEHEYHLSGRWTQALGSFVTGTALQSRVWSRSRFGDGRIAAGFNPQERECFDPARTSISGGQLTLHLVRKREFCNGHWRPYSSGIVSTAGKWTFRYGLLEARIWAPSKGNKIADWPAVWAAGGGYELDVFEGGNTACWYYHTPARRWGKCLPRGRFRYTGGWHTVAADWEPTGITWYYDHHRVARVRSHIASVPMSVVVDLAFSRHFFSPHLVPAKFRIAWLKVWRRAR
jgi:beta-glucanase (GH16 family)